MDKKQQRELLALLKKAKKDKLTPPNMPFDIWKAVQNLVPTPIAEVLMTHNGKDFLLVKRHDKFWDGWHIPGGFMLLEESVEKACSRFAQKELGINIEFEKIIITHAWTDHPYGHPLSLVCVCKPLGIPKAGKFFTKIPNQIIPHHEDFIKEFLKSS